jgi:plastocyanin
VGPCYGPAVAAAALPVGLSAGQKTGIALVAGVFILFAVLAAYVVPERWPDFPGSAGLRPFIAATVALFVAMMLAVFFLARESEESGAAEHPKGQSGEAAHVVRVTEVDYKIRLPATIVEPGRYMFDLKNDGKDMHNLAIEGQGVSEETPTIGPGKAAKLEVDLEPGTYELYCSVPGHRELGMEAALKVT